MRLFPAAALLFSLAACGEGTAFDNSFRESYREKGVPACVTEARRSAGANAAGVDFQPICECIIDKQMEGRTSGELMRGLDEAEHQRIADQCLAEHQGGGGKPPA